jgi:prepilin peptidase CpaA
VIFPVIFSLILFELMLVAWIDFKTEKISNKWIMTNLLISLIFYISIRPLYPLSLEILVFPVGFIVVGFLLYLLKIMGAGDSKYLASLFLLIPLEFHVLFFEKLVLSTLVTGSILFTFRVIKHSSDLKAYIIGHHWEGVKLTLKSRFSYAPVILLAWMMLGLNIWK